MNNERKLPLFGEGNIHVSPRSQRVPNKMDTKRPIMRHNIIKMLKVKDQDIILKTGREKQLVTYRGVPIRLSADLSKEIL